MGTTRTIGIIGAMDEEIELMKTSFSIGNSTEKAGITYIQGELYGNQIVLCKSGVGKVNAAVCTQILIDVFHVGTIIFTGVAGALHPDLDIGDLVVSTDCMQHDMDVTPLGFERGMIPYAPVSIFPADEGLVGLAYEIGHCLFPGRMMKGRVLSGDQFVADRDKVHELHEQLQGICTEMEGAAVAQVCALNRIPFVILRSMSDKADGSAHANFATFTKESANRSLQLVKAMLQQM